MNSYCEWFLPDGTLLSGKEAETYLLSILSKFDSLIDSMRFTLNDCLENCEVAQENTLPNTVMFTEERLSIIQIQLELLLEQMSLILSDN